MLNFRYKQEQALFFYKNKMDTMNFRILIIIAILALLCFNQQVNAADKPSETQKQTSLGLYLTAIEAYKMLNENSDIVFIDVRTRAEVAFLGMAKGVDANIPYMTFGDWDEWDEKKHNFKLFPNSNFLPYFNDYISEHGFNKDSTIILICRSGNRSAGASNLLAQVGYSQVYSIIDGFEGDKLVDKNNPEKHGFKGWKRSNLAWSTKLDEEKMYMEL